MKIEDQETLNEIFLGKEDPDMAFKPMTNNLKGEIDNILGSLAQESYMYGVNPEDFGKAPTIEEATEAILALINQKEKELLEKVEALDSLREQNTHWSACNNHGKGRPNYKCVCPAEPQNELRTEIKDRIKQLKEELNKEVV